VKSPKDHLLNEKSTLLFLISCPTWFFFVHLVKMKIDMAKIRAVWQYRLWSFHGRDKKLESFLAKNQKIKKNLGKKKQ